MSELYKVVQNMAAGLVQQSKELAENVELHYSTKVYFRAIRMFYSSKPFIKRLFISKTKVVKAAAQRVMDLALFGIPSLKKRATG